MKKGLHPETYRLVAFKDMSNDQVFITRSCANTKETIEIEGVVYPVIKLEEQKWIRKAKKYLLYDDQPYRIK